MTAPTVATWILRRFATGPDAHVLIGDLLESTNPESDQRHGIGGKCWSRLARASERYSRPASFSPFAQSLSDGRSTSCFRFLLLDWRAW